MHFPTTALLVAALALAGVSAHPLTNEEVPALIPRGTGCDNIMLQKNDTDYATANLEYRGDGTTNSFFSYSEDVVAFYCQWKTGPMFNRTAAANAFSYVTQTCGQYGAGSYSDKSMKDRTYSYGYTNWRVMDYCNVPAGTRITGNQSVS